MDELMMDDQMNGWMDGRMDGWMNRQIDRQMDGHMKGCMDAYSTVHILHIHVCTCRFRITWSANKDKFIVRFKETNPGVAEFDPTFSR